MPTIAPNDLHQLAMCLIGIGVSTTTPSSSGESGGNWTSQVAFRGTDGTLDVQTSDQSSGAAISGGSLAITSGNWVALGFTLVPFDLGTVALAGTVAAESGASGALQKPRHLAVVAAAVSAVAGTLNIDRKLASTAAAQSTATGELVTAHPVVLAAVAAAASGASGALRTRRGLAAVATTTSTVVVHLRVRRAVRGTASSSGAVQADLLVARPLTAVGPAYSDMIGTIFQVPIAYLEGVAIFDVEIIDGAKYGIAVAGPIAGVGVFGRAA